jgi:hypothetical protein
MMVFSRDVYCLAMLHIDDGVLAGCVLSGHVTYRWWCSRGMCIVGPCYIDDGVLAGCVLSGHVTYR